MNTRRLLALILILGLLAPTAAAAPLAGPCTPGAAYDPACDVDHDGDVDVIDVQLAAGHWNQAGTYVSDNNHNHLGQTWTGSNNPLTLTGAYGPPDGAPLVLSNTANGDGLRVSSAGDDGVFVNKAGNPSTSSSGVANNGFEVAGAQGNGLEVGRADQSGVVVNSAGNNGVYVGTAGIPSTSYTSFGNNGFEVAGAQRNGLEVGRADESGVFVNLAGIMGVHVSSAGVDGMSVNSVGRDGVGVASAGYDGVHVISAGDDGVEVWSAGRYGVHVNSAGWGGVSVHSAGGTGVSVGTAGTPSTSWSVESTNGFQVAGAEDYGLWVGRADKTGVYVHSAGYSGVSVGIAGTPSIAFLASGSNGFDVGGASNHGLWVGRADGTGVYVVSAGEDGVNANTSQADQEWGFYTPDKIYAGAGLASNGPVMLVAQSGDDGSLETGDLVVVSGAGAVLGESESPPPMVQRAAAGDGSVMGVVYRRFVAEEKVEEVERDGQVERHTDLHTHSTDGPISPGDYLLVVVLGPMQVKAAPGESAITVGMRLTAAADGGVRPLQTRTVDGMVVSEGAPVIGVAMGPAQDGLVWVLVNPQ